MCDFTHNFAVAARLWRCDWKHNLAVAANLCFQFFSAILCFRKLTAKISATLPCAEQKRSHQWFDPIQKTFLECVQAGTDWLLDDDDQTRHQLNLSFTKRDT
jgi:hypothetical protein